MQSIIRKSILLVPLLAVAPFLLADPPADIPAPRGYVCYRTESAPTIDGRIDDAVWQAAPWSEDFVDIEGDKRPKPRFRTRMKMLWDEKALYIAAELEEPHIWGTITERDSVIFEDPDFEVFIDPDGDNQLYAELEVNAKNTVWDLLLTKPYRAKGRAINGWDIVGLKTGVAINGTINDPSDVDKSWTVEIAWPLKSLSEISNAAIPPKDGDQWRINFSRVEWDTAVQAGKYVKIKDGEKYRPEHNWVWSPQGVIDMHRPHRWGYVQFSTQAQFPAPFIRDPARGIQELLNDIYERQREYHDTNKVYAKTLKDLGVVDTPLGMPTIVVGARGFEASLVAPKAAGGKLWTIDSENRILSK